MGRKVELTDADVACARVIADSDLPAMTRVIGVLAIIRGAAAIGTIDVTELSLSAEQWNAVFPGFGHGVAEAVTVAMEFADRGPTVVEWQ